MKSTRLLHCCVKRGTPVVNRQRSLMTFTTISPAYDSTRRRLALSGAPLPFRNVRALATYRAGQKPKRGTAKQKRNTSNDDDEAGDDDIDNNDDDGGDDDALEADDVDAQRSSLLRSLGNELDDDGSGDQIEPQLTPKTIKKITKRKSVQRALEKRASVVHLNDIKGRPLGEMTYADAEAIAKERLCDLIDDPISPGTFQLVAKKDLALRNVNRLLFCRTPHPLYCVGEYQS
jgi:hypothetical protein